MGAFLFSLMSIHLATSAYRSHDLDARGQPSGLSYCQILAVEFDSNWSHPARQQTSSSSRVRISLTPHSLQLIPSPGWRLGHSGGAAIHGTDSFRRDRNLPIRPPYRTKCTINTGLVIGVIGLICVVHKRSVDFIILSR